MLEIDRPQPTSLPKNILNSVALERCTLESDPITGEDGWHAPRGLAFKVTGKFREGSYHPFSDPTSVDHSWAILLADEKFRRYLEEAEGDREKAYRKFIDETEDSSWYEGYGYPPDFFVGKWLIVEGGNNLRVNGEASVEYLGHSGKRVHLEDIQARQDLSVETLGRTQDYYLWQQDYAELVPEESRVELIEIAADVPKLYVPRDIPSPIETVREEQLRSLSSIDLCNALFGEGNYSEEMRIAIMRHERESGIPFSDDPLRHLIIPTEWDIVNRLRALYISIERGPRERIIFPGERETETTSKN